MGTCMVVPSNEWLSREVIQDNSEGNTNSRESTGTCMSAGKDAIATMLVSNMGVSAIRGPFIDPKF